MPKRSLTIITKEYTGVTIEINEKTNPERIYCTMGKSI